MRSNESSKIGIIGKLFDQNPQTRIQALIDLRAFAGDKEAREVVRRFHVECTNQQVEKAAAETIGYIHTDRGAKHFAWLCRQQDPNLRKKGLYGIGHTQENLSDPQLYQAVIQGLQDYDSAIVRAAAFSAGLLGDTQEILIALNSALSRPHKEYVKQDIKKSVNNVTQRWMRKRSQTERPAFRSDFSRRSAGGFDKPRVTQHGKNGMNKFATFIPKAF